MPDLNDWLRFRLARCPFALLTAGTLDMLPAIPASGSRLSVCERNPDRVCAKDAPVLPFDDPVSNLQIDALRLAHATKKADCARRVPPRLLDVAAEGFMMENSLLFDWNASNLRLEVGMATVFSDISRTSLAARVAQGIAVLYLETGGYSYLGRFRRFLIDEYSPERIRQMEGVVKKVAGRTRGQAKTPDFVLENGGGMRVLAESKGSFLEPGSRPDAKAQLRDAVGQLAPWVKQMVGDVGKSYAVGSYLTEVDDARDSVVVVVDPEGESEPRPHSLQPEAVRRANYVSWLTGMGLRNWASRIEGRSGIREPRLIRLPVLTVGDRAFAVVPTGTVPWANLFPKPSPEPDPWGEDAIVELMGIDAEKLRILGNYAATRRPEVLRQMESQPRMELFEEDSPLLRSVFSDGTLYGAIHLARIHELATEIQGFEL